MKLLLGLTLCAALCGGQEIYDLILKGGHVIDPKNRRNERMDIAIGGGKIRRVAKGIPAVQGRRVVDVSDYYVTPGLVDINGRFDARGIGTGVPADHNALRSGVTTVADGGSVSAAEFEGFKKEVIDTARTRVLAFVRADSAPEAVASLVRKYPETVVGVRAGSANDAAARSAAEASKTIVMADAAAGLRPGDIYTGVYRSAAPGRERGGVIYDVGHGADAFRFRVAAPAVKAGLLPDTISTAMERRSLLLPRATMTNVMSKFLAMGMTLEQVVERTTVNAARAVRRMDLGGLDVGGAADVAVFALRTGAVAYLDSGNAKLTANRELRCVLTVRAGKVLWDSEGLSLTNWGDAGPYSNFK